MNDIQTIDLEAFTANKRLLNLWLAMIAFGLIFFAVLIIASYFVLNSHKIVQQSFQYKRAESALGFSEIAGLAISAIAILRYINLRTRYQKNVFDQVLSSNGWLTVKGFELNEVPSVLLGTGTSYKEGYSFTGKYAGHQFNCLIFQFDGEDTKTRRFICLSTKLAKAYPIIVLDNKLNDHKHWIKRSSLPDKVPDGTLVKLEGDFNKYYEVSTTKGSQQETLQVLSPDFMAILEDNASYKVDTEISGQDLFLIYEAEFYSEQNINALFSVANDIFSSLDKKSKTWLASSRYEEKQMIQTALKARHQLIYRNDYISMLVSLLFLCAFIVIMLSRI
jgi:hypothetical protein